MLKWTRDTHTPRTQRQQWAEREFRMRYACVRTRETIVWYIFRPLNGKWSVSRNYDTRYLCSRLVFSRARCATALLRMCNRWLVCIGTGRSPHEKLKFARKCDSQYLVLCVRYFYWLNAYLKRTIWWSAHIRTKIVFFCVFVLLRKLTPKKFRGRAQEQGPPRYRWWLATDSQK